MTIIQGEMARLLADLEAACTRIIETHWDEDGDVLRHHGPFTVSITGQDGVIARFMEDGIDLYPEPST